MCSRCKLHLPPWMEHVWMVPKLLSLPMHIKTVSLPDFSMTLADFVISSLLRWFSQLHIYWFQSYLSYPLRYQEICLSNMFFLWILVLVFETVYACKYYLSLCVNILLIL